MSREDEARMANLAHVADELAIRALASRYIDAVYRRDKDAWASTWAEESSWSVMGEILHGRDRIVEFWLQAMAMFSFVAMQMHSGSVEISGAQATGRWYITEHIIDQEGNRIMIVGVYSDRYVKEGGAWLFQQRRYDILYQGPPDLSGNAIGFPSDL